MAIDRNNEHFKPRSIDYAKLNAGLTHYTERGYAYCEVPWVVSHEAESVTLPPNTEATQTQYGDLVGSAEQGFIELMLRGETITKACGITPCFRIEEQFDELHHAYFMKLELINTDASLSTLDTMIADALAFFAQYTDVLVVKTGEHMYDIVDKKYGIELGSYGFRTLGNTTFVYGTGIALPRLDTVLQKTTAI